jgi:ADP-ribosylglycohydrolase
MPRIIEEIERNCDMENRLERAYESLEGLSVGDAFGSYFFMSDPSNSVRIKERRLPIAPWYFTDDTNMALSIVEILHKHGHIDQDALAASFADHYDRSRGYGPAMRHLLPAIHAGQPWRLAAQSLYSGRGSFGNGSAMRIAPLGAYFADDLEAAIANARLSAEITHTHPEAIAGAIAVAVAAAWAFRLRGETVTRSEFIAHVLPAIPESEVRTRCQQAHDLKAGNPIGRVVSMIGNGSMISGQDTVAFTLYCAGECLDNYEEALWLTVSGGGDVDTNAAIVGGIVTLHTELAGIPTIWRSRREALPEWAFAL